MLVTFAHVQIRQSLTNKKYHAKNRKNRRKYLCFYSGCPKMCCNLTVQEQKTINTRVRIMILTGSFYWLHNKFETNRYSGYSSFSACDVIRYLPSPDDRRKYNFAMRLNQTQWPDLYWLSCDKFRATSSLIFYSSGNKINWNR